VTSRPSINISATLTLPTNCGVSPANLLLVVASLGIVVDEFIRPDDAMMKDVGPCGVFHACPGDDRLPIDNTAAGRPLHARHLPLDPHLVSLKPGQAIAIHTYLPVHEVDELAQDIQLGFYLPMIHLLTLPAARDSRDS